MTSFARLKLIVWWHLEIELPFPFVLMAKRKLNRRQKWRIQKIQEERLARAKRKTQTIESEQNQPLAPETSGRVVSNYGMEFDVEDADRQLHRCYARQNIDDIVCGDLVAWRAAEDGNGVIVARQERRTLLSRPDFHQDIKPVAANIDQIIVVSAVTPQLNTGLIDRYLVAVETVSIPPVILINKCDLLSELQRSDLEAQMRCYADLGYEVMYVTTRQQETLTKLMGILKNKTSIFVGQSGVGKSSIIQVLLPDEQIRVGKLSDATGLGRHTTSVTRLYHFPSGGDLIDSPGVRDFALWNVAPEEVLAGFIEFRRYLGKCKFNNCTHRVEPGCAIIQAVEHGQISPQRLKSYYSIMDSLDSNWSTSRT